MCLPSGNLQALAFRSQQRRVGSTGTVWKRESPESRADQEGEPNCKVMGRKSWKVLRSNGTRASAPQQMALGAPGSRRQGMAPRVRRIHLNTQRSPVMQMSQDESPPAFFLFVPLFNSTTTPSRRLGRFHKPLSPE